MNLLAHALLSSADPQVRLGNLLADFVKGRDRKAMPPGFLAGVREHQAVDAFTDLHPIFARSKRRIEGFPYVRGILVDVFYDHLLTLRWEQFAPEPLRDFTARFYADVQSAGVALPAGAQRMRERIVEHDLLGSYGSLRGVQQTLERIEQHLNHRFGRAFHLGDGAAVLSAQFEGLDEDFAAYFPLLREHIAGRHGDDVGRRACGFADAVPGPAASVENEQ